MKQQRKYSMLDNSKTALILSIEGRGNYSTAFLPLEGGKFTLWNRGIHSTGKGGGERRVI